MPKPEYRYRKGIVLNRYLITGASGFVSRHLIKEIEAREPESFILGTDLYAPTFAFTHDFTSLDLLDSSSVKRLIEEYDPTRIVHLASYSSVARSWNDPALSFMNNTNIFLSILEAVRKSGRKPRILSIGSSEEYGNVAEGGIPIQESSPLDPISPYAVARVAQENMSRIYARSLGLDIVITRSFNHIGPGQRTDFVVPSIMRQFLDSTDDPVRLSVGDIAIVRDFLDVRDVARAYHALLQLGVCSEVYNVCSGIGVSISQVLDVVSAVTGKGYRATVDPKKVRPNDNRVIVGDHSKLTRATGWLPEYSLSDSIQDIYSEMRKG